MNLPNSERARQASPGINALPAGTSVRTSGNARDEQIEDRLGGALGFGYGDTPARKMTVDVHPGKAVNQRAAGDLDPLQVGDAQLAFGERIRQRLLGHADQLGVVP